MPVLFSNNASAPLASSISSSATTIVVTTGQGALFPAITGTNYFYATLTNSSNQLEIVKVTARSSDSFTVVRGQEATTAQAYAAADKLELRVTAAGLNAMVQFDAATAANGASLPTLGTLPTQGLPTVRRLLPTQGMPPLRGTLPTQVQQPWQLLQLQLRPLQRHRVQHLVTQQGRGLTLMAQVLYLFVPVEMYLAFPILAQECMGLTFPLQCKMQIIAYK